LKNSLVAINFHAENAEHRGERSEFHALY